MNNIDPATPSSKYRWYALGVLTLTYVSNFIDRQILSILANDIKADLHLTDADLGFLYGTAFAVFYAIFGIPFGRLADKVHRVRLLTAGLSLWSLMTCLSGLAQSGIALTAARVGVGVGEATAGPSAYSLISDYFSEKLRATALAIYSSGLYLGAGLSLVIGGLVAENWNEAYPSGGPLGLVGWQATFLLIGAPGLLLAVWTITLREPARERRDRRPEDDKIRPVRQFFIEVGEVIPPFSMIAAARRGRRTLAINLSVAALCFLAAVATTRLVGGEPGRIVGMISDQWLFLGFSYYAVFTFAASLHRRDLPTFRRIWASPAFLSVVAAYSCCALVSYAASYWTVPYAERVFNLPKSDLGWLIGAPSAVAGFIGVIAGGRIADLLQMRFGTGRMMVMAIGIVGPVPLMLITFTTQSLMLFLVAAFLMFMLLASAMGPAAATMQSLVEPNMRATATATFFLGHTLLGLAIGPFLAGHVSSLTGSLATGVLSTLAAVPIGLLCLTVAFRTVPSALLADR